MTYYETSIALGQQTSLSVPILAGSTQLQLDLNWPSTWEEYGRDVELTIDHYYRSTPLYNQETREIIRTYNFFEYFDQLSQIQDMEAYIRTGIIPYSIFQAPEYAKLSQLSQIVRDVKQLYAEQQQINDYLVWNFTVTDPGNNVFSGPVRKGAWITDTQAKWELQFLLDKAVDVLPKTQGTLYLRIGVSDDAL